MDNPLQVLGLSTDVDAAAIRQRYLELVKAHPPERDPERFALIRAAYDRLKDPVAYLQHVLFNIESTDSIDQTIADLNAEARQMRIRTEALLMVARDAC